MGISFNTIIDRQPYADVCRPLALTDDTVETLIAVLFENKNPSGKPVLTHMLGIPGAGKSTFIKTLDIGNKVLISFDDIMENLPGYSHDRQLMGAEDAFQKWEIPARMIGYDVLHRAVQGKYDILFDNTGSRKDHVPFLQAAQKEFGYFIRIFYLPISNELAQERAIARQKSVNGRYLPPNYIPERQAAIQSLLPLYKELADEFVQIDN